MQLGGASRELNRTISSMSCSTASAVDVAAEISNSVIAPQWKKRRVCLNSTSPPPEGWKEAQASLPTLGLPGYYMEPCFNELAMRELMDPGFSSRVPDFTVGRLGYGSIKFIGETDVRWLDLDSIVRFHRHEVVVYEDENDKPPVGEGLNKAAEVSLLLQVTLSNAEDGCKESIVKKLRQSAEKQRARFISFDPANGQWKFSVDHFSRFGLSEDDEEDIIMDDAAAILDHRAMNGGQRFDIDEETHLDHSGSFLPHSLPAHLGLDPVKMNEMRMLMFPDEEEEEDDLDIIPHRQKQSLSKETIKSPLQSATRVTQTATPPARKTPLALLEYDNGSFDSNSPGNILMSQQNKSMTLKTVKAEGFKLDLMGETPVSGNHSRIIVDAGLFMGRSFGVGWGPNGILVHAGNPISGNDTQRVLSSVIKLEKVAIDKVVRDENNKVREELVDFAFNFPLDLHKGMDHETNEVEFGSFKLKLQKVISSRLMLSEICRRYADMVQKQLEVPGLTSSARSTLMHQILVWELIRVLFSDREYGQLKTSGADNEEDMMQDMKEASPEVDPEALPLIRRAEFSYWLQESVYPRLQDNISSLDEPKYLEHIFLLLTGRQLDAAVELAVSQGDVRLACLLSQAGGSTMNRSDAARQLELWKVNGLDFGFIEKDRIRLYELLAGNIHGALHDSEIDWKSFLGLLMWYKMPPNASLPDIFRAYQHLLYGGGAPCPVPVYIDETLVEEAKNWRTKEHFDISYYLMLLHAGEERKYGFLKNMFSAFSSTHDPLDYHMIWHQRAILEAIGTISSDDLHVLDMGLVSQLLCLRQCHWAIYVVLHMPYREDFPYLQAKLIREILFQYCESWNSQESQRQFIENLGIPVAWLHEALVCYNLFCFY